MLITRWQAPILPQLEQIKKMYELEALEPEILQLHAGDNLPEQRHPFDEVLMVAEGELLVNITDNQFLLRTGDRIVIPSNTRCVLKTGAQSNKCVCVRASKTGD